MDRSIWEAFIRNRITELRLEKNISEHRMSLGLDKSGSYNRSITSGLALPSIREMFNIIAYLDMTPAQFFAPLGEQDSPYAKLCSRLQQLEEKDLQKVDTFLDMIQK